MFGSSEDRARQLAGRHRRERKSSNIADSQRSVSSSSQPLVPVGPGVQLGSASQPRTSSLPNPHQPTYSPQWQPSYGTPHPTPISPAPFGHQSPWNQYQSGTFAPEMHAYSPQAPPQNLAQFQPAYTRQDFPKHDQQVSFPGLSSQSRTDPTLPTQSEPTSQISDQNLDNRRLRRYAGQTQLFKPSEVQSASTPPDSTAPLQTHTDWNAFLLNARKNPQWNVPITAVNSPLFGTFFNGLANKSTFLSRFHGDPLAPPSHMLSVIGKREWFWSLSVDRQKVFRLILAYRLRELQSVGHLHVDSASHIAQSPGMMLYEGLEAAMPNYKASIWEPSSQRSSSMPLLRSAENQVPARRAFSTYFTGSVGGPIAAPAGKGTLNKLFDSFRDNAQEPDTVGPEGSMKYIENLGVDPEGLEVLAVLEVIQAPTMGEMNRDGFVQGWLTANCDTIDKQKSYIKALKQTLSSDKGAFTKMYKYTFQLGKTSNQKAVPLDVALTYWELLFASPLSAVKWSAPNSPWLAWWSEFLTARWKKSVNRDMWNETLKFAQLTLEDDAMSFWNEEASWPSVIDEFVEYVKKEKRASAEGVDVMEE